MLKFLAIAMLSLCCILIGFYLIGALLRRKKILSAFKLFIEDAFLQIRYRQTDVGGMFEEAKQKSYYPFISDILENDTFSKELKKEDVTTMKLFFEGLGKSDVEGQLKHCELYEKRIGDCIADAAEQHTKKGQLYKTLSLISAAAIAVLLI